jgi:hypothetical protein
LREEPGLTAFAVDACLEVEHGRRLRRVAAVGEHLDRAAALSDEQPVAAVPRMREGHGAVELQVRKCIDERHLSTATHTGGDLHAARDGARIEPEGLTLIAVRSDAATATATGGECERQQKDKRAAELHWRDS